MLTEKNSQSLGRLTLDHLLTLKRPQLIALCKTFDIKVSGKNSDLIDKLLSKQSESHSVHNSNDGNEQDQLIKGIEFVHKRDDNSNARQSIPFASPRKSHYGQTTMNTPISKDSKIRKDVMEASTNETPSVMERISQLSTPKRINTPNTKSSDVKGTVCGARDTIFSMIQTSTEEKESIVDEIEGKCVMQVAEKEKSSKSASDKTTKFESTTKPSAPFTKKLITESLARPKLVPTPRPTIISAIIDKKAPSLPTKHVSNIKHVEKKTFDLKASLTTHRPLNYKPYTGPINPFKKDTTTTAK